MKQHVQRQQPHYAAQVGSADLNNAIMENRQRAAQLSQQINKQKAASQQAKPKNSRAPNASASNQSKEPPANKNNRSRISG
jgi:hypothetical protein